METSELLGRVVKILERLGIRYFVTGSMASIFYGEPRFTNDIDIVVDLPITKCREVCEAFSSKEYYVSLESAEEAVIRGSQFNVIHPSSGLKVDFMISSGSAFDQERFARAQSLSPSPDFQAAFATPEDVVLKKMDYFNQGGSDKHLRDISGIFRVSGDQMDSRYIETWTKRMHLSGVWEIVKERLDTGS